MEYLITNSRNVFQGNSSFVQIDRYKRALRCIFNMGGTLLRCRLLHFAIFIVLFLTFKTTAEQRKKSSTKSLGLCFFSIFVLSTFAILLNFRVFLLFLVLWFDFLAFLNVIRFRVRHQAATSHYNFDI